jgi:hypothetical protein|tara:strand:+ start:142 stop:471 length:330 start_codon:yes stop_codon:yes gene_type:complete
MGSKAKKTVRKVAKKVLPDKVEKAVVGPTEADLVAAAPKPETKEAETEVAEATEAPEVVEREREVETATREERKRASRRRARRTGRRQLLSYGRLGAPVADESQKRTLG